MGDRAAFAESCREAGLSFMQGVIDGWQADELDDWQTKRYGELAIEPTDKFIARSSSVTTGITSISDILRDARWKVFAALEQAATGRAMFVKRAASNMMIIRSEELGWVPVNRKNASLGSRVLSLFAVDCLLRPNDYRAILLACPRCERVVFDAAAKEQGQCCMGASGGSGERPILEALRERRRTS